MDELTPIEPEFCEIPPEQPPLMPDYYGTGIQPQPKKSRLALVLTLIAILLAANLATVAISVFMEKAPAQPAPPESDQLLTADGYPERNDKKRPSIQIGANDSTMLKEIYAHYAPAAVAITVRTVHSSYCATGLILTEDGYILTDAEIFGKTSQLSVTLYDGTVCDAAFIGVDPVSEMVILKIEQENLRAVALDDEVGQHAMYILEEFLESAVRPASLNLEVSEVPRPMQIYWELPEGVIINRIATNSNAYFAGLRPGDVLLQIGQITLSSVGDYIEALSSYCAGETVRVYLFREGKTYYADICLEAE